MLEYFKRIIEDKEIEVRLALCSNISTLFKAIPLSDIDKYVAVLLVIGNDNLQVQTAFAQEVNKI